jgi:hypothetical protein
MRNNTEQYSGPIYHHDHMHRFDLDGSFLFWVLVFVVVVKALKD